MNNKNTILIFIVLIGCLSQFAADIYAPGIPTIALSLSTHVNWVQWSMAIYMIGIAATELIYGVISEGVGRKLPLLLGLSLMLIGSIMCFYAKSVNQLIIARFLQGCGSGATAGLWRSIFRDSFHGDDLAKYASYLGPAIIVIIPMAPAVGGYLVHNFGWRAIFMCVSAYVLIALLATLLVFKDTSQHHHKERLKLAYILTTFKQLFTSPIFIGTTFSVLLTYGAFFAWFTAGPVLLIKVVGMTPVHFGWMTFIAGAIAYSLSGMINGRCVKIFGINTMLRIAWSIMILSGFLMLIFKEFIGVNVTAIVIPTLLFFIGSALVWPNAFARAVTPFGKIAGYAGPAYGFMQIMGGGIIGALVAYLPETNQVPLAMVMILVPAVALLLFELIAKPRVV